MVKGPPSASASGVRPAELRESRPERTRTLQFRLSLLVVAITSPALFFFALLSLYTGERASVREVEDRGNRAGEWLDDIFGQSDLTNREALRTEIDRLTRARTIYRDIVVFRKDPDTGDLVDTGKRAGVVRVFPSVSDERAWKEDRTIIRAGDGFIDVWVPLHRGVQNEVAGVAHAEVQLPDPAKVAERQQQLRVETPVYLGLVALAALGLTGIALVFALDRAIGRPVERLVAVMERARQGDLEAQIEVVQMDEFGWLGENFNRMLRKLKENDASLRQLMAQAARFTDELKEKVQQATRELATKNEELARANQRLFEAQRALGQSERLASLGQFASQMAHEIGTPLNSIYGHIQLLAQDDISEGARKRIAIVESQVERLTKIIENVLRTLRLPDAQLRQIDVNPTLTGLAAFTQPVAETRNIRLELKLQEGIPQVYVDSRQLEQVLLNLFTNALDAMPEGGTLTLESGHEHGPLPERAAATAGASDDEGAHVLIRVRDTGVGIPPENILRIFEPFFTTRGREAASRSACPRCGRPARRRPSRFLRST
ncbi:HAMP domain-containing protein [bacterium]|nr:HAMP domain-containing protein [bacterium]